MALNTRNFSGLDEMVQAARPMPSLKHGDLASRNTDTYGFHSWTFGANFDDAVRLASTGWPEGAAKARELLSKLHVETPTLESIACQTFHDMQGAFVDVGQYVEGVPECMVDFREDTRKSRFAKIVVAGTFSAGVSGEAAMARGVAICAVVDALESQGVRCDVDVVYYHGYNKPESILVTVPVKRAADPLNLDAVAFMLAHPACFRRILFSVLEHMPYQVRSGCGITESGGYGSVGRIAETPGVITFQPPEYDLRAYWQSQEYAIQRIQATLDAFHKAEAAA